MKYPLAEQEGADLTEKADDKRSIFVELTIRLEEFFAKETLAREESLVKIGDK